MNYVHAEWLSSSDPCGWCENLGKLPTAATTQKWYTYISCSTVISHPLKALTHVATLYTFSSSLWNKWTPLESTPGTDWNLPWSTHRQALLLIIFNVYSWPTFHLEIKVKHKCYTSSTPYVSYLNSDILGEGKGEKLYT